MNKGIELLLQRMESNPEEFKPSLYTKGGVSKWESLVYSYEDILDKADVEVFRSKIRELRQDMFTEAVMQELLNPTPQPEFTTYNPTWGNVTLGGVTGSTTATISANSLSLGKQTLDEETIKHMKAHLANLKRKEQEEMLYLMFQSSSDILAIVNTKGYFTKVNPAFCKLLNYSEKELMANPYTFFLHPDDLNATNKEYEETIPRSLFTRIFISTS